MWWLGSFCTNWGLSQHQRTCQARNNTSTDSKDAQEVLNVKASSQNSVNYRRQSYNTMSEIHMGKV